MLPEICDRVILSGTLFLIVFSPLAYGGVDGWALSLIRTVLVLMLGTCLIKGAYLRSFRFFLPPFWLPALLFLTLLAFQLTPIPASWRVFFSPELLRYSILLPSSPAPVERFSATHWTQLTLYPPATWSGLLDLLSCLALCWILINTISSLKEVRLILGALITVGIFEAAYGLVEYWSGRQGIFWFIKVYYRDDVTGTYINHNHFAGLMGMIIPLVAGALWKHHQARRETTQIDTDARALFHWKGLFLAGSLSAMLVALVLSNSRGGMISSAVSLMWLSIVLWRRRAQNTSYRQIGITAAILLAGIGLFLGRVVATRFSYTIRDAPERLGLWQDSLKIARDFPLLGTGLGTYKYALPNYRSKLDFLEVEGVPRQALWNFAHNDYLQLLIECGLIGLSLAGWALIRTFEQTHDWRHRSIDPETDVVASSALAAVIAILLHSLVDFNLHIPANALVFSTLLSLALVCTRPGFQAAESADL